MKRQYFIFEFKRFFANRKNIALYILSFLVVIYCALIAVPNEHIIEHVDRHAIRSELVSDEVFLKAAKKEFAEADKPFSSVQPSAGAKDAIMTYPSVISLDQARLKAIKKGDWRQYATHTRDWYALMDNLIYTQNNKNYHYPEEYPDLDDEISTEGANDPGYSGHFGYLRQVDFLSALAKNQKIKLDQNVLEEKTALQQLAKALTGWVPLCLLVLAALFSADLVTQDRQNRTILRQIPLSKSSILLLKTAAGLTGILLDDLLMLLAFLIPLSLRFGLGSLNLVTPIFTGQLYYHPPFRLISLGQYLSAFLLFFLVLTWLIVRLTLLFSLVTKQALISFLFVAIFVFSGRVLYFSAGMGYVYPWLAKLPMTYFSIGDNLSGYYSYLATKPGWYLNWGYPVEFATILVIEVLLFLYVRNRRTRLVR